MAIHKVVTISSAVDGVKYDSNGQESSKNKLYTFIEYPELDALFKEGYLIKDTYPIIKPGEGSYYYAITFVLTK